jgi:hypothetical protein
MTMPHRERRRFKPAPSKGPARQLVMLCVMLLLVVLVMSRAKDPRAWAWLTDLDSARPPTHEVNADASVKPLLVDEELPPGVFVGTSRIDQTETEPQSESPPTPPDIDLTVFEGIRDRTRRIPPEAYFYLLDLARRVPAEDLEEQGRHRVLTFAHFSASPEEYRGQPVFLKGHVRRMTEIKPIENHAGFEKLYEGWLFTEESQDNPYVIIVSRLPENFPLGGSIVEDVSFAGYFLKLWGYRAGDGDRYAPLLIGHRIIWHPRQAGFVPSTSTHLLILAGVAVLIAGLIGVTWYARRITAATRQIIASHGSRPSAETVRALGEMAGPSTEEFLSEMKRLAEQQPPTDSGGNRPSSLG